MNMSSGNQTGAALVVSLIVLLVISVVGIASMNSSILQERMSANAMASRQAFFASEAALQDVYLNLASFNPNNPAWVRAQRAKDLGKMVDTPTNAHPAMGAADQITSQIMYLGEAVLADGNSIGEDLQTSRPIFVVLGSSTVGGSGATATVSKGVTTIIF